MRGGPGRSAGATAASELLDGPGFLTDRGCLTARAAQQTGGCQPTAWAHLLARGQASCSNQGSLAWP